MKTLRALLFSLPAVLAFSDAPANGLAPEGITGHPAESMISSNLGCAATVGQLFQESAGQEGARLSSVTFKPADDEALALEQFETFDKDGNGHISLGEALSHGDIASWTRTLEKYDDDKNTRLSRDEFAKLLGDRRENLKQDASRDTMATAMTPKINFAQATPAHNGVAAPAALAALAARSKQIGTARAAAHVGTQSLAKRHESLVHMYELVDANRDGKLSHAEYLAAGDARRYDAVQGGFKLAIDVDGDGAVSEAEAANAAAFEFDVLDSDRDGFVLPLELKAALESKGWLRAHDWHVAAALAEAEGLAHHVTALIETHFDEAPAEMSAGSCSASDGSVRQESDFSLDRRDEQDQDTVYTEASALSVASAGANVVLPSALTLAQNNTIITLGLETTYKTVAEILATDFCWAKTYDRGVGQPAGCASNYEARGAMCYPRCTGTYSRRHWENIEFCQKPCRSDQTDLGLICRTNGHTKAKGCCGTCWPRNWCCRTWCCGGCGQGWTDTGCFCEPSMESQPQQYSPGKTKYDSNAVGCTNPSYPDGPKLTPLGYFCYPAPQHGYQCQLTACQQLCPSWMQNCGVAACALSSTACAVNIAQKVVDVTTAIVSTVALIASFGTAGAGATQGGRQLISMSMQGSFRTAARESLQAFQQALVKGATKKAIYAATKRALTKEAFKKALKDQTIELGTEFIGIVAAHATNTTIDKILASSDEDLEKFDFTVFDPTGIAEAVDSSHGETDSDIVQGKKWTAAVGTFDPTGWVTVAASFMHPTCNIMPAPPPPSPPAPPPPVPFGIQQGAKLGKNILEIGSWRFRQHNSAHFVFSSANGQTSVIWRSDGTEHGRGHNAGLGWSAYRSALETNIVSSDGVDGRTCTSAHNNCYGVFLGDHIIQIGNWRFCQWDANHLALTHNKGKTVRIYRSDGTQHGGPRTDFNCWSRPLGTPSATDILTDNTLQLGNFRLGQINTAHFSIGSNTACCGAAPRQTELIFRSDSTRHGGPRTSYNPWSRPAAATKSETLHSLNAEEPIDAKTDAAAAAEALGATPFAAAAASDVAESLEAPPLADLAPGPDEE